MTAKEKAKELYSKFLNKIDHLDAYWDVEKDAKECTLIAVDEIIYYLEIVLGVDKSEFEYWQEVKKEIELF